MMRRTLALVVVLGLAVAAGAGVGAAAHDEADRDGILGIELEADGNATIYHIDSYDLDNETEREEFEEFENDENARQERRDEIVADLEAAAEGGSERSGRDMRIENPEVETYEQEGYGRVSVSVEWTNLGAVDGERVVVTEPFSGGYEPDVNRVALHGPPGYRRGTTRPEPARARANSSLWNPETSDLSEFENEFVPADDDAGDGAGDDGAADGDGGDGAGDDGNDGDDGGNLATFAAALMLAVVPLVAVFLLLRRGRP